MGFQAIEAFLPGSNMPLYPRFGRVKGERLDLASPNTPGFFRADEPALLKNTNVPEQGWQGHFERFGKFAYGFRSIT